MPTIPPVQIGQEVKDIVSKSLGDDKNSWSIFYVDYIFKQTHCQKYFKAKDLQEATAIAKEYCNATRTKHVRTWPFICDLEAETKAAIASTNVVNGEHFYQLQHQAVPVKT